MSLKWQKIIIIIYKFIWINFYDTTRIQMTCMRWVWDVLFAAWPWWDNNNSTSKEMYCSLPARMSIVINKNSFFWNFLVGVDLITVHIASASRSCVTQMNFCWRINVWVNPKFVSTLIMVAARRKRYERLHVCTYTCMYMHVYNTPGLIHA